MGEKLPPRLRANSANTNLTRNAGHFKRGSQLICHDLSMWMRGARIPSLIWLGSFILILWLKLIAILDNHELQVIAMRALDSIWDFVGLDAMQNVKLAFQSDILNR